MLCGGDAGATGTGTAGGRGGGGSTTPHEHLRTSPAELREARRRARGIEELLAGLGAKSTREKLEAAHDGATHTHEIGFGTDESSVRRRK